MGLLTVLLALGSAGCGPCGGKPAVQTAAPTATPPEAPARVELSPDRPGRPERARLAMGVNEGVSIPSALLESRRVQPSQEGEVLAKDVAALVDLGVGIVRANTATYPFLSWMRTTRQDADLSRADRWVRQVQEGGLEPLVMLGPWPGNQTARFTDRYVPEDLDAYAAWVGSVVERYDGDGKDDMPGLLRPIRYWEVDNEPDLHNSVPPRGDRGKPDIVPTDFQKPAEYARVLVATSAAIKAADPQAVVLSAGFYRPHTPSGRAYIEAVLAEPGAREAFDVLSVHCYFHEDELGKIERTLQTWQATTPDKPLWVTETGVPSRDKSPWIDEQWQARMVVATYGAFLAGGADRILWHTLSDPPENPQSRNSPFNSHSLRKTDASGASTDKPAGAAYRRLAAHLDAVDRDSLVEVPATGGRLLQAGDGWLAFWGNPAAPAGATVYEDLLTGEVRPLGATVPAPAWISGASSAPVDGSEPTGG